MSRKSVRMHTFILVYQLEFVPYDNTLAQNYIARFHKFDEHEFETLHSEINNIAANLSTIDEFIRKHSRWNIDRLNKIDLALIRLGVYELKYSNTSHGVVINEVVDMAEKFGTDNSATFINGILARISQELLSND